MALLTKEEVDAIRDRARGARACGECETMADDVDRLLQDLAATPPMIVIAPLGASKADMARAAEVLAKTHRGAVHVFKYGWIEATDAQRATLAAWEASAEPCNVAELVTEIKTILLDNKLNHCGAVFEIGELCDRLERKGD